MVRLSFVLFLLFLAGGISTTHAGGGIDDYHDFCYRKATVSKEDCRLFYDFTKELLDGPSDYIKYVNLEDPGDFEEFYKAELASQDVPMEDKIHRELNPLSGVYYFFLGKKDEAPVGIIKINSRIDKGILNISTIFKSGSPKGAGTKALQLLKPHISSFIGKKLRVCIESEEEDPLTFSFGEETVYHVMADIEYGNLSSLIAHTRLGMTPLFEHQVLDGAPIHWISLVYPPLDHEFYRTQWKDLYTQFIAPLNGKMKQVSLLLEDIASSDSPKRESSIKKLEALNQDSSKDVDE